MKFTIKNTLLESVVKAEAKKLRKEFSGKSRLSEIAKRKESIKGEVEGVVSGDKKSRLGELNERRKNIQSQLSEMYSDGDLEEIFGASKFKKAKKAFVADNQSELAAMQQAYKAKDMSYVELSKALMQKANANLRSLANQFGITDPSDMRVLKSDLMQLVQPMDYGTFQRQAQGGTSFKDFAAGSSTGAKDFGM